MKSRARRGRRDWICCFRLVDVAASEGGKCFDGAHLPFSARRRFSAARALSSRARLLEIKINEMRFFSKGMTHLPACFLKVDVLSSMELATDCPSPTNFPFAVTREPALRFFSVCAPVWLEGPANCRVLLRRLPRAFGRLFVCAPPH